MIFDINSDGGVVAIGNCSIYWGNSEDPFFGTERLEGFFSINLGNVSLELGCIDQDRPGIYITKYKDGDIESSTPVIKF